MKPSVADFNYELLSHHHKRFSSICGSWSTSFICRSCTVFLAHVVFLCAVMLFLKAVLAHFASSVEVKHHDWGVCQFSVCLVGSVYLLIYFSIFQGM